MPYPNYKKSTDKQHKAVSKQKIDTALFTISYSLFPIPYLQATYAEEDWHPHNM